MPSNETPTTRVIGFGLSKPFEFVNGGTQRTVKEVLEMAHANYKGLQILRNRQPVQLSDIVEEGDTLTGASSVKGA